MVALDIQKIVISHPIQPHEQSLSLIPSSSYLRFSHISISIFIFYQKTKETPRYPLCRSFSLLCAIFFSNHLPVNSVCACAYQINKTKSNFLLSFVPVVFTNFYCSSLSLCAYPLFRSLSFRSLDTCNNFLHRVHTHTRHSFVFSMVFFSLSRERVQ